MSDFATSIGILTDGLFKTVFEISGIVALIALSIGWLRKHA